MKYWHTHKKQTFLSKNLTDGRVNSLFEYFNFSFGFFFFYPTHMWWLAFKFMHKKVSFEDVCRISTSKWILPQDMKMQENKFAIVSLLLLLKLKIVILSSKDMQYKCKK